MSQSIATLAFGEAAGRRWGSVWSAGSTAGLISVGSGPPASGGLQLRLDAPPGTDDQWRLAGDGVSAVVRGVREWVGAGDLQAQACLVSGEAGGERFEWPGVRTRRPWPGPIDSLRQVLAWFGSERAVAVDALRTDQARGHERDRVSAAILRADLESAVQDARLSTTYDGAGLALRVGLELWLADEQQHPFPHRLAGEVRQPGLVVDAERLRLHISPLSTHYGAEDGSGVMILARAA